MAAYVQWIADRANGGALVQELHEKQNRLRDKFTGDHRRTPNTAASLLLGVEEFLDFATEIGAIGDLEAENLSSTAEQALRSRAAAQAIEQAQEDPVNMFVNAIPSALAAGRAHLTDLKDNEPADDPSLFGWRKHLVETKEGTEIEWLARGDRIGWLVDEQVWLLPDESIAAINRVLQETGRSLGIGRNTLGKRLREKGWLVEVSKDSFTKVVKIGDGVTERVFVFSKIRLFPLSE
jgi:hypothetical protein